MDEDKALRLFEGEKPCFEDSFHQNGQIYWYASDIVRGLGYKDYAPTMKPIQKALTVCMSTNIDTSEQFREEWRDVAGKHVKDFKLSRFACYLVSMNADVNKPQAAKAQAYFAAFAASVQDYIRSQEDVARIPVRAEISVHEKMLNSTAKQAGIENFAYFQNSGYMGLYNMPTSRIRELKGLPEGKPLFDFMGAEELGANIFRITQTDAKIKREGIQGQAPLEAAAKEIGRTVRNAIKATGGTMPEDLAPQIDINKIKGDLKRTKRVFGQSDKKLVDKKRA